MRYDGTVTVYHYDEATESYSRCVYSGCSVHTVLKAVPSENGARYDNLCTVRIPADDVLPIGLGDYVFDGVGADGPDKRSCRTVVRVCDNRRGILRHWRLDCK